VPWPVNELLRHKDVDHEGQHTRVEPWQARGQSPLDQMEQALSMESPGRTRKYADQPVRMRFRTHVPEWN
jgi:hypothetical protein